MGKIKQGILGGFKGKVGTVIGSSWNGISYIRGIAQSVRNANTAAQQTQRGFFKMVSFYRHLTEGLSKRQALVKAQQEVRNKDFTDAKYWATFILLDGLE